MQVPLINKEIKSFWKFVTGFEVHHAYIIAEHLSTARGILILQP